MRAKNRVTGQFVEASQEAAGCTCGWPVCVGIADEVVTPTLVRHPTAMTVDRWYDCMLCGPWVERILVTKPTPEDLDGRVIRRGSVFPIDALDQNKWVL